mgnify:CR=1 FL=1
MIVAASAAQCLAEKCFTEDIDHVVHAVYLLLAHINRRMLALTHPPKSRTLDRFITSVGRVTAWIAYQIARDMLGDKLIKGYIPVQCTDYIIAISPGVEQVKIKFMPMCFAVSHKVKPVASPLLTVVWRGQQPLHLLPPRLRRGRRIPARQLAKGRQSKPLVR